MKTQLKTIIIDDELSGREILKELVQLHCPDLTIVAICSNITDGQKEIEELDPDLVFLDIQMPNGSGFELLSRLQRIFFEVIFVTAFDQYALDAIKHSAADYLLKPVKVTDLKKAVEKVKSQLTSRQENERLKFLVEHAIITKDQRNQRIIIPTPGSYDFYPIRDIVRLESEANYTRFYFVDKTTILASKTMKEFEPLLLNNGFYRIHRSHMINLDYIRRYIKSGGGEVEMTDGSVIEVARDRKDEFLKKIQQL